MLQFLHRLHKNIKTFFAVGICIRITYWNLLQLYYQILTSVNASIIKDYVYKAKLLWNISAIDFILMSIRPIIKKYRTTSLSSFDLSLTFATFSYETTNDSCRNGQKMKWLHKMTT